MTTQTAQRIYWTNALPNHWIAKGNDGNWYMWPVSGTWADKRIYRGHTVGLELADSATTRQIVRKANNVAARVLTGDNIWISHD